ncbi:MAG: SWIM zinc finger family protein [Candidatus Eremiobacteraeota bacterium]|nr:SWIM zinc finger family protein [Candidatus Eremiobacteraeota bacterium]
MAAALDYTYSYVAGSRLENARLTLATCSASEQHPYFFEGRLLEPRSVADQLLVLTKVVRTHFFLRRPAILDPVLTAGQGVLRVEGFSGCCGVYARIDLQEQAFDTELVGRGTTNVDFNEPMRAALARVRPDEQVRLSVGEQEVALARGEHKTVEKKVKLPVRWLKSFSEVQSYGPGLVPRFEVRPAGALAFLRSLPKTAPKCGQWVVATADSLRLSQGQKAGAVSLSGPHRLAVLEPLMPGSGGLKVWYDEGSGVSAWEVACATGRFFLMLSPELYRGFSGEGQNLASLAAGRGLELVNRVRAELRWQSRLDPEAMALKLGCAVEEVQSALVVLGARGAAGYDAAEGAFFHRELPFDLEAVEALEPRLLRARRLVAEGAVVRQGEADFSVVGKTATHFVRLRVEGDRCTCPWFSRHQGQRGPCAHILGAQLSQDDA